MTPRRAPGTGTIALLQADPDLADGLHPQEAAVARREIVTRSIRTDRGAWRPPPRHEMDFGLLIVRGVIAREVVLAGIGCTELLGRGDFMRPWEQEEGAPSVPFRIEWAVVEPATIALLDERFAASAARWPAVASRLLGRLVRQSRSSAMHLSITCLKGVGLRIHVLLWHLADRWGRVEAAGVVVPLRLTHELLARLIRARRPSVTVALRELAERGVVSRRADGTWLLRGDPPAEILEAAEALDVRAVE